MTGTTLRKELKGYIDAIPERRLPALKPLLADMAGDEEYWKPVIEPASPEEIEMVEERLKDYRADPDSFIPLDAIG